MIISINVCMTITDATTVLIVDGKANANGEQRVKEVVVGAFVITFMTIGLTSSLWNIVKKRIRCIIDSVPFMYMTNILFKQ